MRTLSSQGELYRLALVVAAGLLVAGCGDNEEPDDNLTAIHPPEVARIMSAQEALAGANIPKLNPAPMNDAEVRTALGARPLCEFRYTTAGRPVLAVSTGPDGAPLGGIVKLNGSMISLKPALLDGTPEQVGSLRLVADPVRMTVMPDHVGQTDEGNGNGERHLEANAVFEVGQSLKAGYRGYVDCMSEPPRKSPRH